MEHCGELWPGELESDGEYEIDLRHDPGLDVGVSGEVEGGQGQSQALDITHRVGGGEDTVKPVISLRSFPQHVPVCPEHEEMMIAKLLFNKEVLLLLCSHQSLGYFRKLELFQQKIKQLPEHGGQAVKERFWRRSPQSRSRQLEMLNSLGRVTGLDISLGLSPVSPEEGPRGRLDVRLPKHEDSDKDDQY